MLLSGCHPSLSIFIIILFKYTSSYFVHYRLYIGFLKGVRRNESAILRSFKETETKRHEMESSLSGITQAESKLLQNQTDDLCDSLHHLFSLEGESSSSAKSKLQISSSSVDHMKSFGLKIERHGESDFKVLRLDPKKFEKLELSEVDMRKFVATWKHECLTNSSKVVCSAAHVL
jgi:hypothetical protein